MATTRATEMPTRRLNRNGKAETSWATPEDTETATVSHGTIDGAIRSGERAALEVMERS